MNTIEINTTQTTAQDCETVPVAVGEKSSVLENKDGNESDKTVSENDSIADDNQSITSASESKTENITENECKPSEQEQSDRYKIIEESLVSLEEQQDVISNELKGMSTRYQKSYAEIITRLSGELEKYKSHDRGKLVIDLIRALAKIYIVSQSESESKFDVLDRIKELIDDYDAELVVSEVGTEYSRKHHKPSREPWLFTDDERQDGKIAQSLEAGLRLGNDMLILETVKLFKYENNNEGEQTT